MKKKVLLWIAAILAALLLLGSFFVRDYLNMPNEADIMRVIGFIFLILFTVYGFRGDKKE